MFHQLPTYLDQINKEESKLTKVIGEFTKKLESVIDDFSDVLKQVETQIGLYDKIGTMFNLNYRNEMTMGYRNLQEGLKIVNQRIKNDLGFLKQPVFNFMRLHNEQTETLKKFITQSQEKKKEINKTFNRAIVEKVIKQIEVEKDVNNLNSFLNFVTHNQFRTFFVLKSQNFMLKLDVGIQEYMKNNDYVC